MERRMVRICKAGDQLSIQIALVVFKPLPGIPGAYSSAHLDKCGRDDRYWGDISWSGSESSAVSWGSRRAGTIQGETFHLGDERVKNSVADQAFDETYPRMVIAQGHQSRHQNTVGCPHEAQR